MPGSEAHKKPGPYAPSLPKIAILRRQGTKEFLRGFVVPSPSSELEAVVGQKFVDTAGEELPLALQSIVRESRDGLKEKVASSLPFKSGRKLAAKEKGLSGSANSSPQCVSRSPTKGSKTELTNPSHRPVDKSNTSVKGLHRTGTIRNHTALLSIECCNLKGRSLGASISSKCVVSGGEYEHYLGKRKNFRWEVVGETEIVPSSNSPSFETSIEIAYDLSKSRLLRFDILGSESETFENFHIGAFVCEIHDLLKADSWELTGTLIKKGKGAVDNTHLHFEVTKNIRATMTPQQVMNVFKTVDIDKSMSLSKLEFKNAMRLMAKQGGYNISKEGEGGAWEIAELNERGDLNYAAFVGVIFGTQGSISVMIEDRGNKSVVKHADLLFNKYRKKLAKRLGRNDSLEDEPAGFDAASYEKESLKDTCDRAMRLVAGVSKKQFNDLKLGLLKTEMADNAGVLQVVDPAVLVASGSQQDPMEWGKRSKARGIVLTKGDEVSVATCNLLNRDAGPCSVMSAQSLPDTGITFLELSCVRDGIQPGGSLDGPYALGLATGAFDHFDGCWTRPHVHNACFALVNIKPAEYEASWSLRHRGSSIFVYGMDSQIAGVGDPKAPAVSGRKHDPVVNVSNVRAKYPLPRGNCYFEITIKAAGQSKDESLGGRCHVGLCSEAMAESGWEGEWTKEGDARKLEAWTLCDNWNGQLSTSVFGLGSSEKMSEQQMRQIMLKKFNHFDKDNSGTIDWEELHLALKDMAICCTDDEVEDMFTSLGMKKDGHIHFEEFVSIVRSRAATGVLFHGEKVNWCLNSFFGVGDKIGFQVDSINGLASISKNGVWLGRAFSELPECVYPFVSLPRKGMTATIAADLSKNTNSKCDVFAGGHRKPWIEGSNFGSADRVGFCVDMDRRTCEIYKNGSALGIGFERLPSNLHAFATLCHTGAKAVLSFPPKPNPWWYEHMRSALSKSKYLVSRDVPCACGKLDLAEVGSTCGIVLEILADHQRKDHQRGDRRFVLRACDIESLFDCNVLGGTRCARIVSPLVEVCQTSGPSIDAQVTQLSIPHCCSRSTNLKLVFMPSGSTHHREHRNVWAELDAKWTSRQGTCSVSAPGIFCILCFEDPTANPDLVYAQYRLFDPGLLTLDHLPDSAEPKFCMVTLGAHLKGSISLRPVSAVASFKKGAAQEILEVPLARGSIFEPLTALGYTEESHHEGVIISDSECLATSGCALWIKSSYNIQRTDSGRFKLSRNPEASERPTDSPSDTVQVRVNWKGAPLELPFRIQTVRIRHDQPQAPVQVLLSRRMGWNSFRAEHDWSQFQYIFDPETGAILEGPKHAIAGTGQRKVDLIRQILSENRRRSEEDERELSRRRRAEDFRKVGTLPSTVFEAEFSPDAVLRNMIHLGVEPSSIQTSSPASGDYDWEHGDCGLRATAEAGEKIILASGRKEDRDAMLVGLRYFMARHQKVKPIQQILLAVTLSAKPSALAQMGPRSHAETAIAFSPLTLSISDNPIKHTKGPR